MRKTDISKYTDRIDVHPKNQSAVGAFFSALGRLLLTIPHLSNGTLDFPGILSMQAASVHVHLDPDKKGLFSQVDGETIIERGYDFYSRISPWKIDIICPG